MRLKSALSAMDALIRVLADSLADRRKRKELGIRIKAQAYDLFVKAISARCASRDDSSGGNRSGGVRRNRYKRK